MVAYSPPQSDSRQPLTAITGLPVASNDSAYTRHIQHSNVSLTNTTSTITHALMDTLTKNLLSYLLFC